MQTLNCAHTEGCLRIIQSIRDNAQGFDENKTAAEKGGTYAGKALETFEKESGMKVVSKKNFLEEDKKSRKKWLSFRKKKKKD